MNPSAWSRLAHRFTAAARKLLFWMDDEPTVLGVSNGASAGVVICYHCRRRITQQEMAAGQHNHAKAAAAAGGAQAQEQ